MAKKYNANLNPLDLIATGKPAADTEEENPALAYLSTDKAEAVSDPAIDRTKYKPNPEYIEKKTVRVQLVCQESVITEFKAIAKAQHKSVNSIMGELMQNYIKEYRNND